MALVSGYGWKAGSTKQVIFSKPGFSKDGHIHELSAGLNGSWTHVDLTQLTGAPAGEYSNWGIGYDWEAGGTKQVIYFLGDGTLYNIHVHEIYRDKNGSWKHAELTSIAAGAALAYNGASAAYPWNAGAAKQVVYQGADFHIRELYVTAGGSWQHADLTQLAGAPAPMNAVTLTAFEWPAAGTKQVVYADGAIHELSVGKGGSWKHANLTNLTGAPPLDPGSEIYGYAWNAGGAKQVVYVSGGHIHELYVEKGGAWKHVDLTNITGAPLPTDIANSPFNAYAWEGGNAKQVVYVANGSIHELSVIKGGSWKHANLTQLSGAPGVASTSGAGPFGYEWVLGGTKQVVYPAEGGHIHEMSASKNAGWKDIDLTVLSGAPPLY